MEKIFSVIVPIYKVEPFLEKCVDSILNQTFSDFELILVDDGSPDRCPEICDEYARKDSRVRVIHKKNGGLVNARNTGIGAAEGRYICYVDGDDWIDTTLLETVYQDAIVNHDPDMVIYGAVKKFSDRDEMLVDDLPEGLYVKEQLIQQVYPYMMYDSRKPFCKGLIFPVAWNKIYKRELLEKHYCENEKIRMGEDNAFVYECVWHSERIYISNKVLYFYNQLNAGSMVNSYDPNRFYNNQQLTSYMESRLGGLTPLLDQQLNAFKAYWLIMAVFHEVKNHRPLGESAAHIRKGIRSTGVLKGIQLAGLPLMAKGYVVLLRLHLYRLTLLASKVVNSRREGQKE